MSWSLFTPLVLAVLVAGPALAQRNVVSSPPAAPALTLERALALAEQFNPELSAARSEIAAVAGARLQAGARPNPTLGVEVEDLRQRTRTNTVLLSQPIELGGKRAARIAAAERGQDIAAAQLATRRIDVRAAVTAAYFDALVAAERVRLAEASLQLASRARDAATRRVAAGKVSPIEETRSRVAEAGVRLELVQARSELKTALQNLRSAIGSQTVVVNRLTESPELLPATLIERGLEQRILDAPALREARLEIERQRALVALEQAQRIPDLTVGVGARRGRDALSGSYTQAVVTVSIPLPVFDTNRGNVVQALRREDKARDEALAIEQRLRADAYAAQQRLSTAREEAIALKTEVLPGAQDAFDATTKGFTLGKFSFLDALDAQRTLLAARAQYLRALAETHRAAAELQRLLGTPGGAAPGLTNEFIKERLP